MTPELFCVFDYNDWDTFASLFEWHAESFKEMDADFFLGDKHYPNVCFPTDIIGTTESKYFGLSIIKLDKLKDKIGDFVAYRSDFTGRFVASDFLEKALLPKPSTTKEYPIANVLAYVGNHFSEPQRLTLADMVSYHVFFQRDMSVFDFFKKCCIAKGMYTRCADSSYYKQLENEINERVRKHNQQHCKT